MVQILELLLASNNGSIAQYIKNQELLRLDIYRKELLKDVS